MIEMSLFSQRKNENLWVWLIWIVVYYIACFAFLLAPFSHIFRQWYLNGIFLSLTQEKAALTLTLNSISEFIFFSIKCLFNTFHSLIHQSGFQKIFWLLTSFVDLKCLSWMPLNGWLNTMSRPNRDKAGIVFKAVYHEVAQVHISIWKSFTSSP